MCFQFEFIDIFEQMVQIRCRIMSHGIGPERICCSEIGFVTLGRCVNRKKYARILCLNLLFRIVILAILFFKMLYTHVLTYKSTFL